MPDISSTNSATPSSMSDTSLWEKSEHVLWAPMPTGIVLQHLPRRLFLELHGFDYWVWTYLDGTRSVEQIADTITQRHADLPVDDPRSRAREVFEELRDNGFLVERMP